MAYKNADGEYFKEKILAGDYKKVLIEKNGLVKARILKMGEIVKIYFYNEVAEIETRFVEIKKPNEVLVTKTINNKEYNTIMSGLKFHKTYTKKSNITAYKHLEQGQNLYVPIVDPVLAYEINENLQFTNVFNQNVKLCPGDFIIPYDASHKDYYSIYQYNFQDNYTLSDNTPANPGYAHAMLKSARKKIN